MPELNVTIETAYREACQAIGEGVVNQRLLAAELTRLAAENERLAALAAEPTP